MMEITNNNDLGVSADFKNGSGVFFRIEGGGANSYFTQGLKVGGSGLNSGGHIFQVVAGSTGLQALTATTIINDSTVAGTKLTGSFTGSFTGLITNAQTASYVETAQTASYVETAQTASFITTAQTASYVEASNIDGVIVSASYALSASFAVSASHEIIKEVSSSHADTADTASYVETAQTASYILASNIDQPFTNITASNISASGNLFSNVTDSSNTGFKTVVYDPTTGQFFRTGSYAPAPETVESASYALSSSFSQTASYVETAQTASYIEANNIDGTVTSASYALSASFAVSASHEIIKEVSSSHADTADTASYVETAQTASYVLASNIDQPFTNITASVNISASGDIISKTGSFIVAGIGTSSPATELEARGTSRFSADGFGRVEIIPTAGNGNTAVIKQSTGSPRNGGNLKIQVNKLNNVGGNLFFATSGDNTRMTISSSGDVGIGTTTPGEKLEVIGNISASGLLFANLTETDTSGLKTVVYNSTTGQFFRTGSYGSGGGEGFPFEGSAENYRFTISIRFIC